MFDNIKSTDLIGHTYWKCTSNMTHYCGDFYSSSSDNCVINQESCHFTKNYAFTQSHTVWYDYIKITDNSNEFKLYTNKKDLMLLKLKYTLDEENEILSFLTTIKEVISPYDVYDFIIDTYPGLSYDVCCYLASIVIKEFDVIPISY